MLPSATANQTLSHSTLARRHRPTSRPRREQRRAAVAVEFAVAAPMFFLFLFACIEFGRLNMINHAAENAAYEAARHAIVPGATAAEATARANAMLGVFGVQGTTVVITPDPLTVADDELTVTVTIPLDQNAWFIPRFASGRTVSGVSKLRTERGKFIP